MCEYIFSLSHQPRTKNLHPVCVWGEILIKARKLGEIHLLWDLKLYTFKRQSFRRLLNSINPLTPHCFKTLLLQPHALYPHPALWCKSDRTTWSLGENSYHHLHICWSPISLYLPWITKVCYVTRQVYYALFPWVWQEQTMMFRWQVLGLVCVHLQWWCRDRGWDEVSQGVLATVHPIVITFMQCLHPVTTRSLCPLDSQTGWIRSKGEQGDSATSGML